MLERRSLLADGIEANPNFDAVVIGGGINGIGVFRDLSLQGLRVFLVEKNDFCSGCSAAPSRMIHGGLRYLENGEFDLVRESLTERDALLRNAPHMVRPLPTVIPITSFGSGLFNAMASFFGLKRKPAERGVLPIKLGLSLYDWVTRHRRQLPKHTILNRASTRSKWPFLTKKAKYAAIYFDAWISHPERLCIELLKDMESAAPQSIALNYARLSKHGDTYTVKDMATGRAVDINPRTIVNASGAWLDDVARSLQSGISEPMVSGTKGSHLILDNQELYGALNGHMVYYENADGRVCVVFPYQGRVLAGSTDIRVDKPARVKCEPDELTYILESLSFAFDGIAVRASDVVFSYSGIRPLPTSDADFTGRIPRGHFIRKMDGAVPQFNMIGGKWTTFRAFGELTADKVLAELGKSRKCSTLDLAIGGGKNFPPDQDGLERNLIQEFGVCAERAKHLAAHYGTSASIVQTACAKSPDDAPLSQNTQYSAAEIGYLFESEYALTISDLVLRRTSLAIRGELDGDILDRVTDIVAQKKPLTADEAFTERKALVEELLTYHGASETRLASKCKDWSIECA